MHEQLKQVLSFYFRCRNYRHDYALSEGTGHSYDHCRSRALSLSLSVYGIEEVDERSRSRSNSYRARRMKMMMTLPAYCPSRRRRSSLPTRERHRAAYIRRHKFCKCTVLTPPPLVEANGFCLNIGPEAVFLLRHLACQQVRVNCPFFGQKVVRVVNAIRSDS